MKLIVGLGNPEGKYFNTYHNAGFLALDLVTSDLNLEFKKKGNQLLAKKTGLLLLKPITYMNNSGQAVIAVMRKYKISPENLIVIYDDLYIDKGNIRVSFGGSGGGHNGIRSINQLIGTNGYTKIRIGIKPDKEPHCQSHYVLSKISSDVAIEEATRAALMLLTEPLEKVQQKFNKVNNGN